MAVRCKFKHASRLAAAGVIAILASTALAQEKTREGTIQSVDVQGKVLTVRFSPATLKITVDNTTVITKDGKAAGFDSLQAGATVTVSFGKPTPDGRVASKIEIGAPAGAAKAVEVAASQPAKPGDYQVAHSVKIGGEGKCDSLALDPSGKLLYVPRMGKVMILDLAQDKVVAEIPTKVLPRSIALAPAVNRGFITVPQSNAVIVFDTKTKEVLGQIAIPGEPSACTYDAASKKVLVCCSEGKCIVPIPQDIDPKTGKPDAAIELDGRPTSIVADQQGTAYVTVTDADQIAVIDTNGMSVVTKWTMINSARPSAISLDNKNGRIYVGLRTMRLAALSIVDGREVGGADLNKNNVEETGAFDGKAFVSTSEGNLMVIGQGKDGRYEVQQTLKTGDGAYTLTVDSKSGIIYMPSFVNDGWKHPARDSFKILTLEKK